MEKPSNTNFFDHWNFNEFPKTFFQHSKIDKFNSWGYRGNDFKQFEDNKKYLITIGDSWTFCSGIFKEEDTWPYLLSRKLNCDYFYNLAIGGRSVDYVARTLHLFFNLFKPKGKIYIAGIFPSTLRTEFFTNKGSYVGNIKTISELPELGHLAKLVSLTAYKNVFSNAYTNVDRFIRNYLLIEYICNLYNIELVWTNWYMFFRTAINNDSKINNFYYDFCYNNKHFLDMYRYFKDRNIEFEYLSDDDKHPNHNMQPLMADAFYKFLNKEITTTDKVKDIEFTPFNTECEYRSGYENTL